MHLNHSPENDSTSMQLILCMNQIKRVLSEDMKVDAYAIEAVMLDDYIAILPEWYTSDGTNFWDRTNSLHEKLITLRNKYEASLREQREKEEKDGKAEGEVPELGR